VATKLHNQMTGADLHPNAIDGTTGTELTAPSLTVLEAVAQPWHAPCTVVRMNVHALVRDERWALVEPLLPPHPAHPQGGTRWRPDRPARCGIIDVLQTGMRWNDRPLEVGCGSGSTCWRRLRDGQAAGVWPRLHRVFLDKLGEAGRIDGSRASLDSASVRARRGARRPGKTRRIAANRARSVMWWSTGAGSRWSRVRPGRRAPTRPSSRRSWRPSRRSGRPAGGGARALGSDTPTRGTTGDIAAAFWHGAASGSV